MLKVVGIEKSFETPEGTSHAVRGVDFEVAAGEFYTLVGPSGCGKTTTLRSIAGFERPDSGQIWIGDTLVSDPGRGIHVPAHSRDFGMVFQSYAIWPHMNVFENVAYPLTVRRPRPPRGEIEDRVMKVLRLVGMEPLARRSSSKLSGGQQQRVALARALVREPKLLLLDEPLSNLDAKLREQMRDELRSLVERVAITTLYVTHDQAEALTMSDRIAVMSEGRIVQEGPPRAVYGRPACGFVAAFLGSANFVPARVREVGEGVAVLTLEGSGEPLRLPAAAEFRAGDAVDVVVRPEDVTVEFAPPVVADGVLAGTVRRVSFQGGQSEIHIDVAGTPVRAVLHPNVEVAPGDRVWLRLDVRATLVFPRAQAGNGA